MSRNHNFCFTWNNFDESSLLFLRTIITCQYVAWSEEIAPTTGTPHLQGYIHWDNAVTFKTACRRLPGCHIEVMRGRIDQNETYCSKVAILEERGIRPQFNINNGANEASRWEDVWSAAIQGRMDDIPHKIRVQYYSTFKKIAKDYIPVAVNLEDVCGIWIYGPPGTGKTRSVVDKYPEHYEKMPNKWWDDYQGEEIVFLDEFDSGNMKDLGPLLKSWADFKKFRCEDKGSSMCIRPKKFIVCSNQHLNELLPVNDVLYQAIARRFKFLYKPHLSSIIDF